MIKVFYDPTTLKIKGFSTGEVSMEFPYVETEVPIYFMDHFAIEITDGVAKLVVVRGQLTDEEWERLSRVL